jgi:hypothetical protein
VRLKSCDRESGKFTFRFEPNEREWFARVLEMYPVQEEELQPAGSDAALSGRIKRALAATREKLKADAALFLRAGKLEIDAEFNEYWDLTLSGAEVEDLLQILNNIRVGCWRKLGMPDPNKELRSTDLSEESVRTQTIMHVCAAWQGVLMFAVNPWADPEAEA